MTDYRSIDLKKWRKVGSGANANTFVSEDESSLLKLNKNDKVAAVLNEYDLDRKVSTLGIPSAGVQEIVKVGERLGIICQNIKHKKSYSRLIADDPERIREYTKIFVQRAKELHATECNTELFTGKTERLRKGIENAKFIDKYKPDLFKLVDEMDGCTTCLHGDMQTGNLINADGKDYWIDFDRFSYGDPIMDMAHMYTIYVGMSWFIFIQRITHMNKKLLNSFWEIFIEEYYGFGKEEVAEFTKKMPIYNALDLLQNNYMRPGLLADLITLILAKPSIKKYFKQAKPSA